MALLWGYVDDQNSLKLWPLLHGANEIAHTAFDLATQLYFSSLSFYICALQRMSEILLANANDVLWPIPLEVPVTAATFWLNEGDTIYYSFVNYTI